MSHEEPAMYQVTRNGPTRAPLTYLPDDNKSSVSSLVWTSNDARKVRANIVGN